MLKSERFGHVGHFRPYRLARAKLTDDTQLSRMGNVIYGTKNAWESIAKVGGPVLRATTRYRPQFEPVYPLYRRKLKALRGQPYSTTVAHRLTDVAGAICDWMHVQYVGVVSRFEARFAKYGPESVIFAISPFPANIDRRERD